jgi:NitT/TauT family transport system ATP-binding protein
MTGARSGPDVVGSTLLTQDTIGGTICNRLHLTTPLVQHSTAFVATHKHQPHHGKGCEQPMYSSGSPVADRVTADVDNSRLIQISGLSKRYNQATVLDDINLSIGEQEIVSIVGPSGCGKTTLLRCIEGLMTPSEGSVTIGGEVVSKPLPGVAMVFQHFGLFPWKTVYSNVAYGLKVAGVSKAEIRDRIPEFIELVGLTGYEKAYPYQLSGGMQQRAGLARALATEPRVLVMDEPFGAIDAQTRDILQFELLRIWESRPMSMVFVTHSIEESVLMGDRVVVLKGRPGKIWDIVDVDFPHPRTRDMLSSKRFAEVRDYVWNALMDEAIQAEKEFN